MPMEREPLEDELGDVLEKAMKNAGLNAEQLARCSGVDLVKIKDAGDYRYDLTPAEVRRLAAALGLNEVGFCALAGNHYPLPGISGLPFRLHTLRMPFGVGVVNAYLATAGDDNRAILFDGGTGYAALVRHWPETALQLDAVFLTHAEAEHTGGLPQVLRAHGLTQYYGPRCRVCDGACHELGEGDMVEAGGFRLRTLRTPGHAAEHNCYLVETMAVPHGRRLLVAGDLIFAGSLGGGYFCSRQLLAQARRVLEAVPDDTIIAPGHGPLTTAGHERRFNPFII
jgi:glyoxylase-like metal-dependent hydrolase (beta-lactamase superfamily II)